MLYLDNASTSYPKPHAVGEAMAEYIRCVGASPGRGSYTKAYEAERVVAETRTLVAEELGTRHVDAISFTLNATHALNTVIKGLHRANQSIIVSTYEHNSVLRPAYRVVAKHGGSVMIVSPCAETGIDLSLLAQMAQARDVGLVVCSHVSNVTGRILPIPDIARIVRAAGVPLVVDVSQSAGVVKIAVDEWDVDYVAGTAHKGLLGPQGVGFLFARDAERVETLVEGGAGGHSLSPYHPQRGPEKFEAGTPNVVGLAGLRAALLDRKLNRNSYRTSLEREYDYVTEIAQRMARSPDYCVMSPFDRRTHVPILSVNRASVLPSHLAFLLEARGIATRSGLHCAPLIHQALATYPTGSVRLSFGPFVDDTAFASIWPTFQSVSAALS